MKKKTYDRRRDTMKIEDDERHFSQFNLLLLLFFVVIFKNLHEKKGRKEEERKEIEWNL